MLDIKWSKIVINHAVWINIFGKMTAEKYPTNLEASQISIWGDFIDRNIVIFIFTLTTSCIAYEFRKHMQFLSAKCYNK